MILVTGATGFIGKAVADALAAEGEKVVLLARELRTTGEIRKGVKWMAIGDIAERTDWVPVLEGVSHVINLAARAHVLHETEQDPFREFMRVNCDAAVRLFAAAQKSGVRGFLQLSSVGVVGATSKRGTPITEATPLNPQGLYARSKLAADTALIDMARGGPTSLVILRPPLVCGPGASGNLARLVRLVEKRLPLPLKQVRNRRSLLALANLVSATSAVIGRWRREPANGVYVLADNEVVSTSEIIVALREGLGRPPGLFSIPNELLSAVLKLADGKLHDQLLADLEIDASGFSAAFAWSPITSTHRALVQTGLAVNAGAGRMKELY